MFTPQNDLERSLIRAFDEPAHRPAFLKSVLEAELSLALMDPQDGRGGGYAVPEVTHEDLSFVPIFTSDSRVQAMFGDERLMVVRQTFRQILEQVDGANFVLNPGSDYGHELMAEDIAAMLDGDFERAAGGFDREPEAEEGDDLPTLVGRPSPMPMHLTAPLAAHMLARAAWLANVPQWEHTVVDEWRERRRPGDPGPPPEGEAPPAARRPESP